MLDVLWSIDFPIDLMIDFACLDHTHDHPWWEVIQFTSRKQIIF